MTTAPGRRRFSDDELLDAALELFHARGYHSVQMAEIAEKASTTKPTLYARVGSKEQIYIRVLEREAAWLKASLFEEYERAANQPFHELVEIAMLAIFRFADQRRAGFELLFRGEPGGPGLAIGERGVNEVIDHVTRLIDDFIIRTGGLPGAHTSLLAAAAVGVGLRVCQRALDTDHDLGTAGALATAFTEAATRLGGTELNKFDIRRPCEAVSTRSAQPPKNQRFPATS